ncbi:hypothetical protein [Brachybacterium sp. FME24]|uniref:hypothetical protein n=1 Tax=Brachybacterium sp. FME24 TaxID=2742605 RepID=UPI0018687C29|nr:hypothetical protein [Brachybacterium sp. FME24]
MQLPLVTILFLGLAVLVALGILFFVAAPHLRARDRDDRDDEEHTARDRRHTSRTGR